MVSAFNPYEQQLDNITHADWNTQYLSNEARVKERHSFLQYKICGLKIGSLIGRVCKLLRLNHFDCVRKFFSCGDLQAASQIIKDTIKLINDKASPPPSNLSYKEKYALFERVTLVFNSLFDSVNAKKAESEKLPTSSRIDLTELVPAERKPIAHPPIPETKTSERKTTEPTETPKTKKKSRCKTIPSATTRVTRSRSRVLLKA